jgi:hypothetical protein
MTAASPNPAIWRIIGLALNAEPREQLVLRGASGIDHQFEGLSVDDKNRRLILVLAEPDARVAALVRSDIQSTMADTNVLVARPIIFDLGAMARGLVSRFGGVSVEVGQVVSFFKAMENLPIEQKDEVFQEIVGDLARPIAAAVKNVTLPTLNQIIGVLQQAAHFDWSPIMKGGWTTESKSVLSLEALAALDNIANDRRNGVCAIPLYQFEERDWELLMSATRIDDVRARLSELGISQYFFPSPDQLALGLIDQGVMEGRQVSEIVRAAPDTGHPLGSLEILQRGDIGALCEELAAQGLVAEGEFGFELSETGVLSAPTSNSSHGKVFSSACCDS